ncbi:winged helix-turn-helix transcriptional regulator [Acidobacteria bacterium AB60]|nr:winged helix-turn-helix transcriptional regulator [Acidobacteria bacterium AB60]
MLNIRSSLRRDLLTWLKMNPTRRIWVRGLAQFIGADPTNLSRELARLQEDGIVSSETEGRQLYYWLNADSPKVASFFELLGKSIGVEATLAAVLGEVRGLESVFAYVPRSKTHIPAEIKLLLVGAASENKIDAALNRISGILGRPVKHHIFTQATLQRRMAAKDPSLKEFWRLKPISLKEKK